MASPTAAAAAPSDATRPSAGVDTHSRDYRPALDGVRAIAVTAVVGYHFGVSAIPGGFLGVDVFFALSGYLITSVLLREYARRGHISLSGFYIRRLRRLFPALALVVLVVAAATLLYASPLQLADRYGDMVSTLFYYANWHFVASDQSYFAGLSGASPLRHTWSLAIEEQFYFVWPLLLLVALRLGALRRRWVLLAAVALATAASTWAMARTFDPLSPSRSYYGSDGRAQQLLVGVLLALALHGVSRVRRGLLVWQVLSVVALAALAAFFLRFHDQATYYYRGGALLAAVATVLLIAGVERAPDGPVGRLLSIGPVVWLGQISYGVYLWHWPMLVWLHTSGDASPMQKQALTVVRVAATLAVATASFYLVERPIRLGQVPWMGRSARRTALAFVVTIGLLSSAAYAATRPSAQGSIAVQAAEGSVTACPHNLPCLRVDGPQGGPVVSTVGDSTMQSYDPGLMLLAREHGFRYVQGAVGGCPIGHRLLATGSGSGKQIYKSSNKPCFDRMPGIYRTLIERERTTVFIATSSNEQSRSVDAKGRLLIPRTPAHLAATEAALDAAARELTSRGAYLVLLHQLPRGPGVACLESGAATEPRCNVPVASDTKTPVYNAILDKVAARYPDRVKVVDLSDVVCPDGVCSLLVHDIVMRYDGGHFTQQASEYVAPFLYERMRKAGVPLP